MWTLGTVLVKKDGDFEALEAQVNGAPGTSSDEDEKAIHEAKKAIKALVKSGAFGSGPFRITASGHANKGNKDDGTSGPDHVGINVVFDDMAEVPSDIENRLSRPETHDAAKAELALAQGGAPAQKAAQDAGAE